VSQDLRGRFLKVKRVSVLRSIIGSVDETLSSTP